MGEPSTKIGALKKLQKWWYEDNELENSVNSAFDRIGFTKDYVESCREFRTTKHKSIKDSIWGMIDFDQFSMRLIDSPVFQRLRGIHQLGFSYVTYPTAEHTRFSHSLGTAHVVSRIVEAIAKNSHARKNTAPSAITFAGIEQIGYPRAYELVHAALLHDIGHLPFSHATESAIEASQGNFMFANLDYSTFKIGSEIAAYIGKKISLSEMLSVLFILSPRFCEFYNDVINPEPENEDAIYRIACLIAELRVSADCGNIQSIISSAAVDADKIDYINRDARACGIPVGVDVSRVFLGSSIVKFDRSVAIDLGYSKDITSVFALNASGWDSYDEIIRARSMLYQRVYLHAVTRTAESLLSRALKLNSSGDAPLDNSARKYKYKRDKDVIEIWSFSDAELISYLKRARNKSVSSIAERIFLRNLPKKAFCIDPDAVMPAFPVRGVFPNTYGGPANIVAYREVRGQLTKRIISFLTKGGAVDSVALEDEIREEAIKINGAISAASSAKRPVCDFDFVSFIPISGIDQKKPSAPILQNGELLSSEHFTNASGVSDATEHFRMVGYVMAPPGWREIVCVATCAVLSRKSLGFERTIVGFGPGPRSGGQSDQSSETIYTEESRSKVPVSIPATHRVGFDLSYIVRKCGINHDTIVEILNELDGSDYSSQIGSVHFQGQNVSDAEDIVRLYGKFIGEGGWSIDESTVDAFLMQFPQSVRKEVAQKLKDGRFLDRDQISRLLDVAISDLVRSGKYQRVLVVPLSMSSGGATYSSIKAHWKNNSKVSLFVSVSVALDELDDRGVLVFVDDNAASGCQAAAHFLSMAGIEVARWPARLQNEGDIPSYNLDASKIEKLLSANICLAVALGHGDADKYLTEIAEEYGYRNCMGVKYGERVEAGESWSHSAAEYLRGVGKALVAQDRFGKSYEALNEDEQGICNQRALGYNDIGGVTFFPYTCPTWTVTAFWMPGVVNDVPWLPLGLRWGRLNKVVL